LHLMPPKPDGIGGNPAQYCKGSVKPAVQFFLPTQRIIRGGFLVFAFE